MGICRTTDSFPGHERYGLISQMRRAAVSVPSNIAEGHARTHTGEYLQHVSIALGSLAELQTHIEIATRLDYLPPNEASLLLKLCETLAKQLTALRNALRRKQASHDKSP